MDNQLTQEIDTMLDETNLKNRILVLEKELNALRQQLFLGRLYNIIGMFEKTVMDWGVSNINIVVNNLDLEWRIKYDHHTDKYNVNDYNNSADSDEETEIKEKKTTVSFGVSNKYYIKTSSTQYIRFKIYMNSKKELRIINEYYDIELDLEEQEVLLERYANNKNIPEWLAIRFFRFMSENEWYNEEIIHHFSFV